MGEAVGIETKKYYMKTKKLLLVLAAIALLFAMTVVGCDEDLKNDDSTKDNAPKAANFESVDILGNIYILAINGETSRAVYKGTKGDDYTLTIKQSGQPDKESKGIVSTIKGDGELTMKPTKADDTFNVSISKSGKMTAITGTITLVDGTTVEAPGFLSIADMAAWLSVQGDNTVDKPYTVKVNVNDHNYLSLKNAFTSPNRYIILDLSGSTITNIPMWGDEGNGGQLGYGNITSVIIPDSVTRINSYAFRGFKNLTEINIPDSVISIGDLVFAGCTNLTVINIGKSLNSIGNGAFSGCTNLTAINVDIANTSYSSQDGVFYNKNKTTLIQYPQGKTGAFTIPDSVTAIGNSAFADCTKLTGVTIPDSVTAIGWDAFSGTPWLTNQPDGLVYVGKVAYIYKGDMPANTNITLLDGTKRIANEAFKDRKNLTGVTIPDGVTSIGDRVFRNTSLTSVIIPSSVTSIGQLAFDTITLTSIDVDSGNSVYSSEDGVMYNKDKTVLHTYPARKGDRYSAFTIPDNVTSIDREAFYNCVISSITIPASVTSIGPYAFYSWYVNSVTFEGMITSENFGNNNFEGDLRVKYLAGGIGTYTTTDLSPFGTVNPNAEWTKQ